LAGAAVCNFQGLEADEPCADEAGVRPEERGDDADEIAPGWQSVLRQDLQRRLEKEVARLAETASEDDELRVEDVDEGAEARPEPPADLANGLERLRVPLARAPTSSRPVVPRPRISLAARSAAPPDASCSKWPWPEQFPLQGSPPYWSTMCPSSAPAPTKPR
jgi:hypothetical protein